MKKVLALVLTFIMAIGIFAGCAKDDKTDGIVVDKDRLNYNYDMSKYVSLDTYKTTLDSKSEMYQYFFNGKLREMMVAKITEGAVQKGDVVNIDYVGKNDGIAFQGGTAYGYDLEIGSKKLIDGFEEGLIGAAIGETIDLALKFPTNYQEQSLAGKDVVFTVKVNYVSQKFETVNNENAKLCGYASAEEVMNIAKQHAIENSAWETVYEKAKIETNPQKETKVFYDEQLNSYERAAAGNNMTLEQYVSYYGMTVDDFKKELNDTYVPQMANEYTLSYYIMDTAGESVTEEKRAEMKKELDALAGGDVLSLGITENFIEAETVKSIAYKIVSENATVE